MDLKITSTTALGKLGARLKQLLSSKWGRLAVGASVAVKIALVLVALIGATEHASATAVCVAACSANS